MIRKSETPSNIRLHALIGGSDDALVVSHRIRDMSIYSLAVGTHYSNPENIIWAVIHEDWMGHWELVAFDLREKAWDYVAILAKHQGYTDYTKKNLSVMYRDKQFGEGLYT